MNTRITLSILFVLTSYLLNAQVAISYDGSEPTSHTILDVKSDTTGFLIPRMTTIQRNTLAGKLGEEHQGMLVYDKTGDYLFFWNGSEFETVANEFVTEIRDTDNDTYVDAEVSGDPNIVEVGTNGVGYWQFKDGRIEFRSTGGSVFLGQSAGQNDDFTGNENIMIGYEAGMSNTTGARNVGIGSQSLSANGASPSFSFNSSDNTAVGHQSLSANTQGYKNTVVGSFALSTNTSGQRNSALGYNALLSNTEGYDNVAIGHESLKLNETGYYNATLGSDALYNFTTGYRNIAIGKSALYNLTSANYNIALGASSMFNKTSGSSNIAIGYQSGYSNTAGDNNVFIGHQSGYSETGSNKLYIDNSNTTNPLIYGEFDNDILGFMGNVGIGIKSPLTSLHVVGSSTLSSLLLTPNEAQSGDDAELILAEDLDNTYGMSLKYDGGDNRLYFYGKSDDDTLGPHLTIERSGFIGIGTSNPSEAFEVVTTGDARTASFTGEGTGITDATVYSVNTSTGSGIAGYFETTGTDATIVLEQNGTGMFMKAFGPNGGNEEWNLRSDGVMQFYNANSARTIAIVPSESGTTDAGQITFYSEDGTTPTIEIDGDYNGDGRITTNEIQITGGSDLSEFFELTDYPEIEKGMVVSIDENNPGQLKICETKMDKKVAGIVSGANDIKPGLIMSQKGTIADGEHLVALSGRVYCMVDATENPVEVGDMLTTSSTPGHAMKVVEYSEAQGAIIGKAMTSLDSGTGLVLVLVSLQ